MLDRTVGAVRERRPKPAPVRRATSTRRRRSRDPCALLRTRASAGRTSDRADPWLGAASRPDPAVHYRDSVSPPQRDTLTSRVRTLRKAAPFSTPEANSSRQFAGTPIAAQIGSRSVRGGG